MTRKYIIGSMVLLLIGLLDIHLYTSQEVNAGARVKKCFPTGKLFTYKDQYGTMVYDQEYHTISAFELTDQNNNTITNRSMDQKIYVANFFFVSCMSICPKMITYMHSLQEDFKMQPGVKFLSHTIDPENDTIAVLKKYAIANNIDGNKWHLLTGTREALYKLSKYSYYPEEANDSSESFSHSDKLVLIDQHRVIRGYYKGTDAADIVKLKSDITSLLIELKKEMLPK